MKRCACGAPAAYTMFDELNMTKFLCGKHATEFEEKANADDRYSDCLLIAGVEETMVERADRLTHDNVLANGAFRKAWELEHGTSRVLLRRAAGRERTT